jgi:hypothetical protein
VKQILNFKVVGLIMFSVMSTACSNSFESDTGVMVSKKSLAFASRDSAATVTQPSQGASVPLSSSSAAPLSAPLAPRAQAPAPVVKSPSPAPLPVVKLPLPMPVATPPPVMQVSTPPPTPTPYVYSNDIRLLYLSLRNVEPTQAISQAGMQSLDKSFRNNPSSTNLLDIRRTLVDLDALLASDVSQACHSISNNYDECLQMSRLALKGGRNIFDVVNQTYIHKLVQDGTCGAVNEAIGIEFTIDFGTTPACDKWVYLSNLYAGYSMAQIHADFVSTPSVDALISSYISANGASSQVSTWHGLLSQGRLSLHDIGINIQVYK